ncbi:Hypothetical protein, putative [Bodo saltans]|uniref:EF-hand domain-containing protein n=1 Tax=Bodo saltans TaxID=75058 RepID=A0A0S4J347_BODSA|nr:Hypothetical protein, putative [Bodo saltans]|eukprot:CUG69434.1 Hypothetical protein, putative [Bodo saltans]
MQKAAPSDVSPTPNRRGLDSAGGGGISGGVPADVAAAQKAASRLTFEPTTTPDAVIVKAFQGNRHIIPQPPFPRLHPTVDQERAQPYLRQKEEERKAQPLPMLSIPTPTTPWYPEATKAPILGKALTPNLASSLSSPRSYERAAARNEIVAEVSGRLGGQIPINCRIFFSCFCAEMNEKGYVTPVQMTKVFREVSDIVDISHVDSYYQLLDPRRRGAVHVLLIIASLDIILNGPQREVIRRSCFAPFDLDDRGYIHKAFLDALKKAGKDLPPTAASIPGMVTALLGGSTGNGDRDRPESAAYAANNGAGRAGSITPLPTANVSPQRPLTRVGSGLSASQLDNNNNRPGSPGPSLRTSDMVKVLNDIFVEIGKEEEDAYIASLSKGKKSSKKKKAPPLKSNQKSVIPVNRARITHMDFAVFDRYFNESKTMSVAFARCWLPLVESDTDIRLHIVEKVQEFSE